MDFIVQPHARGRESALEFLICIHNCFSFQFQFICLFSKYIDYYKWQCMARWPLEDHQAYSWGHLVHRGYYTVARRFEFYVRVARTISHSFASLTREIFFLPLEHKIHIFEPTCNVLFIIWRNQFNKSKRRESWRHWTMRHSQRWHTENTLLGSRMKWRMESTSGLVPSKTLSSI